MAKGWILIFSPFKNRDFFKSGFYIYSPGNSPTDLGNFPTEAANKIKTRIYKMLVYIYNKSRFKPFSGKQHFQSKECGQIYDPPVKYKKSSGYVAYMFNIHRIIIGINRMFVFFFWV